MNAQEAATLCRATKAVCPGQKFDEATPDFWHPLLEDIDYEDAKRALIEVAKRQPWVAPADIRAEVARHRRANALERPPVAPPRELADHPTRELEWVAAWDTALNLGHRESEARQIANRRFGIDETPQPALEAGGLAAVRAQMDEAAREIARKQSLREAEAREKAEAKRARHAAMRAELEAQQREARKVDRTIPAEREDAR